jgi:hypothetical protein
MSTLRFWFWTEVDSTYVGVVWVCTLIQVDSYAYEVQRGIRPCPQKVVEGEGRGIKGVHLLYNT